MLDGVEGAVDVPLGFDEHAPAAQVAGHHLLVEADDVEEGSGDQRDVLGGEIGVEEKVEGIPQQVRMREHRALRPSRGPGGEEEERRFVAGDLCRGNNWHRRRGGCWVPVHRVPGDVDAESLGGRRMLGGEDEQGDLGVGQLIVEFGRGQAPVEWDEDGAQAQASEQDFDEGWVVGSEVGDPVASADAT